MPPYYVALTGFHGRRSDAVIRASATGAVLAIVTPPRPYGTFTHVTGAADDVTFVLAAQRWAPMRSGRAAAQRLNSSAKTKFFLLRFSPAARSARLTGLAVPGVPGGDTNTSRSGLAGLAVSPDGGKLAIMVDRPAPAPLRSVAVVKQQNPGRWVSVS